MSIDQSHCFIHRNEPQNVELNLQNLNGAVITTSLICKLLRTRTFQIDAVKIAFHLQSFDRSDFRETATMFRDYYNDFCDMRFECN